MKNILEHKWTPNITAFLNVLVAIVVPIVVYILQKSDTAGSKSDTGSHWTGTEIFLIIVICFLLLIYGVTFINARAHRGKIEVIGKLSALQESHILAPHYVTATQHAKNSKEADLSKGGTAEILTNSLKYDIFYSDEIAKHLIKGAKYIYILPNSGFTISELQNYITKICEGIQRELNAQGGTILNQLDELRSKNLEFWFFNDENFCLYNFAIFRQTTESGLSPFLQYWWYINPSDTNQNGHMRTYEIQALHEKRVLEEVLQILKSNATQKNGKDVFDNRTNLSDWINGEK
jgi:hypothetical protein